MDCTHWRATSTTTLAASTAQNQGVAFLHLPITWTNTAALAVAREAQAGKATKVSQQMEKVEEDGGEAQAHEPPEKLSR